MKTSFDESLGCARSVVHYTETYKDYDPSYLMLVVYNDIETRPVELILEIAEFLEVQVSEINARKIALKYSREKVKSLIEKSNKSLAKKLARERNQSTTAIWFTFPILISVLLIASRLSNRECL